MVSAASRNRPLKRGDVGRRKPLNEGALYCTVLADTSHTVVATVRRLGLFCLNDVCWSYC